jgi:phage terminase Nu1 subunit (DNA packaging protein)
MATVNVTRVASFLNLTEQRVQQLVKEGMPRESRGQYDAIKCAAWYIRYLQNALEKRAVPTLDGRFVGEREERVRLLRAEATLKEIELAKEQGQMIALSDVEATLTDLVLTTKSRIMAIPPRLAPELVGETSRVMVQAKIEKACKEALAYLAKAGKDHDTRAASRDVLEQAPIPEVGGLPAEV